MDQFVLAKQYLLDGNGKTILNGYLEFFDADDNALTVYTTAARDPGAVHPLQIRSDSSGLFDPVFLPVIASYKYKVSDQDYNEIYTFEGLEGKLDTSPFTPSSTAAPKTPIEYSSENTTIETTDKGDIFIGDSTSESFSYTLPGADDLGNGNRIGVKNNGTANAIVVRPASGDTINGQSTYIVYHGQSVIFVSDGSDYHAITISDKKLPFGFLVKSRGRTSPLTNPNPGDADIPTATATGAYAGFEDYVMVANGIGGHIAHAPYFGQVVNVQDDSSWARYDGAEWKTLSSDNAVTTTKIRTAIFTASGATTLASGGWAQIEYDTTDHNDFGSDVSLNVTTFKITAAAGKYRFGLLGHYTSCGDTRLRIINDSDASEVYEGPLSDSLDVQDASGSSAAYLDAIMEFEGDDRTYRIEIYTQIAGTELSRPDLIIKEMKAPKGDPGIQGTPGNDGDPAGLKYSIDLSSQVEAAPGNGLARPNNSDLTLVSEWYIDDHDSNGNDVSSFIQNRLASTSSSKGIFVVKKSNDVADYAAYEVTAVSNETDYTKVTTTHIESNPSGIADTNSIVIQLDRNGDKGDTGLQGMSSGLEYRLDLASTTDEDPLAGNIRFDAALGSATKAYISDTDANGTDKSNFISKFDDSTSGTKGYLFFKKKGDHSKYAIYAINAASVDATNYTKISFELVEQSGLVDTDDVTIDFLRTGDQGQQGNPGNIAGMTYQYNVATSGDPGAGYFGLNNADPGLATEIRISDTDYYGSDLSTKLAGIGISTTPNDKGSFDLTEFSTPENNSLYKVTGAGTDNTTYWSFPISHQGGGGSYSADDEVAIDFSRTGNAGAGSGDMIGANNLSDVSNVTTSQQNLDLEPGVDVQAYDEETLKADTDDNLTAGYTSTADNDGTKSSGTYTPDPAGGNLKRAVNGGAFILAAPTATGDYTIVIQITNNASAGAITLSGFSKETGDSFTTTDGDDFMCYITKVNGFTHINTVALQ